MTTNTPDLEQINYDLRFLKKPKWILFLIIMFFLVIVINFPLTKKIDNLVFGALSSNPRCPIMLESYEINIFPLPHLALSNLNIPNRCLSGGAGSLIIPKLKAYFRGPSLIPLGVSFKIETAVNQNPLEAFITAGYKHFVISLKENKISFDKLAPFIPQVQLAGDLIVDAHVEIEKKAISVLNIKVQSNNFAVPAQTIQGFMLQRLNIKNLLLTAVTENRKVNLNQFILGDESSPVRSEFTGKVALNKNNIKSSTLDLSGQLAIADKILEENFLLKSYLGQFDKKDNFYQLKITGPMIRPSVKSNSVKSNK